MSNEKTLLEELIHQQTLYLQKQIHKSSELTAATVIESMLPSIEKEMEAISSKISKEVCQRVVLEITGEDYTDIGSRRRIRDAVQWAIRSCQKNTAVVNGAIVAAVSGTISTIIALAVKGIK